MSIYNTDNNKLTTVRAGFLFADILKGAVAQVGVLPVKRTVNN